jgi:hypothetical protein
MSEKALKEVGGVACVVCGVPFSAATDVIRLCLPEDAAFEVRLQLMEQQKAEKAAKAAKVRRLAVVA